MTIKNSLKIMAVVISLISAMGPSLANAEELEAIQNQVEDVAGVSLGQMDQKIDEMIKQYVAGIKVGSPVVKLMCAIFNFGTGQGFMEGRCVGTNLKTYKISVRTRYAYGVSGVALYGSFIGTKDMDPRGQYGGATPSVAIIGGPIGLFGASNDNSKFLILSGVQGGVFFSLPAESIELK